MKIYTYKNLIEAKTENVYKVIDVNNVSPIFFTTNKLGDKDVEIMHYLCETADNEKFIMQVSYVNLDNDLFLDDFQLSFKNKSIQPLAPFFSSVINEYDKSVYITDTGFNLNEDGNVYLFANKVSKKEDGTFDENIVRLNFNYDNFAMLSYISNLICEENIYSEDLGKIINTSYKSIDTSLYIVDNIKQVSGLYRLNKNAIVCKFIVEGNDVEPNTILASFMVAKKLARNKFKNNTIKNYLTDIDQFLLDYKFDVYFRNLGKTYTCIRAYNKNREYKLYLLSDNVMDKLEKLINEY